MIISLDRNLASLCDRKNTANIASGLISDPALAFVSRPSTSAHRVTRAVRRQRRGAIRNSMSVQEYIDKHELTKVVEDAVNAAVKVKPDEPLSFLVRAILPVRCIPIVRICAFLHQRGPPQGEPFYMHHARWESVDDDADCSGSDRSRVDSCPNFRK